MNTITILQIHKRATYGIIYFQKNHNTLKTQDHMIFYLKLEWSAQKTTTARNKTVTA
jgi:ABC-type lipopolysaccharide export system ATPase subunit